MKEEESKDEQDSKREDNSKFEMLRNEEKMDIENSYSDIASHLMETITTYSKDVFVLDVNKLNLGSKRNSANGEEEENVGDFFTLGANNLALAISKWIEESFEIYKRENGKQLINVEDSKLSIEELILKKKVTCKDPRFESGGDIAEALPVKPSLTLNLYLQNFSVGNSTILYPYDRNTKTLIDAIGNNRIPGEFLELFKDMPVYYRDGCVVLELKDYRNKITATTIPFIKRILLTPSFESIVTDTNLICQAREKISDLDRLKIESSLLLHTKKHLCLDPSPNVFYVNCANNYNTCKSNLKFSKQERCKRLKEARKEVTKSLEEIRSPLKEEEKERSQENEPPTIKSRSKLFNFLQSRQNTPLIPKETKGGGGGELPINIFFGGTSIPSFPPSAGSQLNANFQESSIPTVYPNHELSFTRQNGNIFYYFKLHDLPSGLFQGTLRVGDLPDRGDNGSDLW